MPRKHLLRINGDKCPGAAGQNFTLSIADFCNVDMSASVHALFRTGDGERLSQRHGLEILDFHGSGERQHVAKLVHLAHGFIQDRGDNAAVSIAGRPGVFARQLEVADGLTGFFVQRELQAHTLRIIVAAAKAMVLARLGFAVDGMAVENFALWHLRRATILAFGTTQSGESIELYSSQHSAFSPLTKVRSPNEGLSIHEKSGVTGANGFQQNFKYSASSFPACFKGFGISNDTSVRTDY
jgi:hypothetical protein